MSEDNGGASDPMAAPVDRSQSRFPIWLTLIILVFVGWVVSKSLYPSWQYKVESIPDLEWDTMARDLGDSGWEIVSCRRARDDRKDKMLYECIFKKRG